MKIALAAPIEETVPPRLYGGTEWIIYHLANELGSRGHQIDLYTTGDSPQNPHYRIIPVVEHSIRLLPEFKDNVRLRESKKLALLGSLATKLNAGNYDIIHNHMSWRLLLVADLLNRPVVTTHHGPLNFEYQDVIYMQYKNLPHVSISDNQRRDLPDLNFVATIYNGIDTAMFPYVETVTSNQHMMFLARMSPEKGGVDAAKTAHATNRKLIAAAKVDAVDKPYFELFKPYIDHTHVEFLGEIGLGEKDKLLQTARCLLVPIKWEEPFGLMFTEAMSSGTPVITYSRGSAPEIIQDGVTGFLVNESDQYIRGNFIVKKTGVDGLCEAVERIYSMSDEEYRKMRQASRKLVDERFTVEKMVNHYEKVYQEILNKG